jgi:hypothetical protein
VAAAKTKAEKAAAEKAAAEKTAADAKVTIISACVHLKHICVCQP